MARKHTIIFKNDTITLSFEEHEKFWLYDKTRGMNLAMRAETEQAAFIEALEYYQQRTADIEKQLKEIKQKINSFLEQFEDEEGKINYY